jgi:NAD(P)-dependent dehydrogenase (short-subunit alcohol dehydrogenase family)
MIDLGFEGRRAMVAGAGHRPPRPGIGRAAARLLAEGGARVACIDIDEGRASAVAGEIGEAGGEAIVVVGDMRLRDDVERAVDAVTESFGGIDICVDIIGEANWNTAVDFTEEEWDAAMDTNLKQAFLVFQAVAKRMAAQGTGGAIAAVASVDGVLAAPFHLAYGCAKAGLVHLVKTMAEELGSSGIRINAVAPGMVFVPTDDVPSPVFGAEPSTPLLRPTADDIASGLIFLCSNLARAVSGQTLAVDGGASVKGAWDMNEAILERLRSP